MPYVQLGVGRTWYETVVGAPAHGIGCSDGTIDLLPDVRAHLAVVKDELDRMHREEPTRTSADLARVACPTLVMGVIAAFLGAADE